MIYQELYRATGGPPRAAASIPATGRRTRGLWKGS